MRRLRVWVLRLVDTVRFRRDREFDRELQAHLALHIDHHERNGSSALEARRMALLELGGVVPTSEAHRDRRRASWLPDLMRDGRLAVRSLRHSPGYCLAAVVIFGLAI